MPPSHCCHGAERDPQKALAGGLAAAEAPWRSVVVVMRAGRHVAPVHSIVSDMGRSSGGLGVGGSGSRPGLLQHTLMLSLGLGVWG